MELLLSEVEARVLAALVEKAVTTPQYYPLTVNALVAACNQKNARSPVMTLSEGEVGAALNALEAQSLVSRDDRSGRVVKWRHHFNHQLLIQTPTLAVLTALMLRGPQTVSELRSHAEPLGGPGDNGAIEAILGDLTDRAQPLVRQLPRIVGQSATRWVQLLCGEPDLDALSLPVAEPRRADTPNLAALLARIEALEARVAALEGGDGG